MQWLGNREGLEEGVGDIHTGWYVVVSPEL